LYRLPRCAATPLPVRQQIDFPDTDSGKQLAPGGNADFLR
jgi:hypothetical protein